MVVIIRVQLKGVSRDRLTKPQQHSGEKKRTENQMETKPRVGTLCLRARPVCGRARGCCQRARRKPCRAAQCQCSSQTAYFHHHHHPSRRRRCSSSPASAAETASMLLVLVLSSSSPWRQPSRFLRPSDAPMITMADGLHHSPAAAAALVEPSPAAVRRGRPPSNWGGGREAGHISLVKQCTKKRKETHEGKGRVSAYRFYSTMDAKPVTE